MLSSKVRSTVSLGVPSGTVLRTASGRPISCTNERMNARDSVRSLVLRSRSSPVRTCPPSCGHETEGLPDGRSGRIRNVRPVVVVPGHEEEPVVAYDPRVRVQGLRGPDVGEDVAHPYPVLSGRRKLPADVPVPGRGKRLQVPAEELRGQGARRARPSFSSANVRPHWPSKLSSLAYRAIVASRPLLR